MCRHGGHILYGQLGSGANIENAIQLADFASRLIVLRAPGNHGGGSQRVVDPRTREVLPPVNDPLEHGDDEEHAQCRDAVV